MRTILLAAAAAFGGAAALLLPAVLAEEAPAAPKAQRPYVSWWGPDSHITARECVRATTEEEWRTLWARHMDLKDAGGFYGHPIPEIDFSRCVAVGVFQGRSTNTRGLTAVAVLEEADRLLLRCDWQSRSYQTLGEGDAVTPFGIFVLPRCDKPLVVEMDANSLKDHGPVWKERARFGRP